MGGVTGSSPSVSLCQCVTHAHAHTHACLTVQERFLPSWHVVVSDGLRVPRTDERPLRSAGRWACFVPGDGPALCLGPPAAAVFAGVVCNPIAVPVLWGRGKYKPTRLLLGIRGRRRTSLPYPHSNVPRGWKGSHSVLLSGDPLTHALPSRPPRAPDTPPGLGCNSLPTHHQHPSVILPRVHDANGPFLGHDRGCFLAPLPNLTSRVMSQSCSNLLGLPQPNATGWRLRQQNWNVLPVLEAGRPRSRCRQVLLLLRPLPWDM